jgi:hypothetical protein
MITDFEKGKRREKASMDNSPALSRDLKEVLTNE